MTESQVGTAAEPVTARRPLALVADDEAEVRELVSDALVEAGFETLAARDRAGAP